VRQLGWKKDLTAVEQQQDQDGTAVPSWSCSKAVYKPVWHIPLLCVQWITPDDGQRNCPKHVEFHFQNKTEKSVHLVGFIIRKFVTIHGHMNVKKILSLTHSHSLHVSVALYRPHVVYLTAPHGILQWLLKYGL
jgi:hypothetical protein